MAITSDLRPLLEEVGREPGRRIFRRIPADKYHLSIQASDTHHSEPRQIFPAEDYECWEVAVFTPEGAWATPKTHPQRFGDRLWGDYWIFSDSGETASGQYVPTEVVQTFYDFLVLGQDLYDEMSVLDGD